MNHRQRTPELLTSTGPTRVSPFHRPLRYRPRWHLGKEVLASLAGRLHRPSRVSQRYIMRPRPRLQRIPSLSQFHPPHPAPRPPMRCDKEADHSGKPRPINPLFRCTGREHLFVFKRTGLRQRNTGYPTRQPPCLAGTARATLAAWVRHGPCQSPGMAALGTSCARSELASMLAVLTLRVRLQDRRPRQRTISYTSSSWPSAAQGHPNGQPAANRPTTGLLDPPALLQIDPVVYFRR